MNRFIAAVLIIVMLLSLCTYSYWLFSSTREEMVARLGTIEASALAGEEVEKVMEMCREYRTVWEEKEKKLMRFIRHPQLDEISSLTAELRYLASGENYSHLLAAIDRIRANLDKVGNAEMFSG